MASHRLIQPLTTDNDDDRMTGRLLNRRDTMRLFGSAGAAALLVACGGKSKASSSSSASAPIESQTAASDASTSPAAGSATSVANSNNAIRIARPEETEGPYFVDEKLNRSDIRSDPSDNSVRPGTTLTLVFNIGQAGGSQGPIAGATVDVWHCDAAGVYSDVSDPTFNTQGKKFLRGYQATDASGMAKFTTIYPGWYQGRAVHIHFKIRTTSTDNKSYEFTSQLFFDESLTADVYKAQPYAAKGTNFMKNKADSIYDSRLLLDVTKSGDGYTATFPIALDLSDSKVGAPDGIGSSGTGGGPAGRPPGGGPPAGAPPPR